MNSARGKREDLLEVIADEDAVTVRLPCRVLDDPATVVKRLRNFQSSESMFFVVILVGILWVTFAIPYEDRANFLSVLAPMVLSVVAVILFAVIRTRRFNRRAVQQQQTRAEIQLRTGELLVRERTSYPDRWIYRSVWPTCKRLDPLDVGRLRIERTEISQFVNGRGQDYYDENAVSEPYLWTYLNEIEYSLVADDHDGRVRSVLAHAYPRDVLTELARRLKRQLDAYRVSYDRQLAAANPGIKLPDYGDGIPICLGPRLREPKRKPKRPKWTEVTFTREQRDVVICVPRGGELEEIEFRADPNRLTVTRRLLLGEIEHPIASHNLRKVYVRFEELAYSDYVHLVIEYYDPETRSSESLDVLNHLSTREVCWIAAELREACPPTGDREDETVKPRFQYSIAHLLYATTLVCVFLACARSVTWGWIFGIQAVAAILCLTSFTGIRLLAPYTNRSWTKSEIIAACVIGIVLCFVWWSRYTAIE